MIRGMALPHTIERDKALPDASHLLMAAQDDAARITTAFVPIAPKMARVQGGIASAQRLRRAPGQAKKLRPNRNFTRIAAPKQAPSPNKASLILMAASHQRQRVQYNAYGLPIQPRTPDVLDMLQRRMRAIMIRDTLSRRFEENRMDMADGKPDIARMVDAKHRFQNMFQNRAALRFVI